MIREKNSKKFTVTLFLFEALAIILLSSVRIYAQVSGATLTGTVSDASGAVIPNAHVSIRNVATGQVRAVTTDATGFYTAPNLLPAVMRSRSRLRDFRLRCDPASRSRSVLSNC